MKAVVLIGGQGTRLRPLTYTTTKAMLPIVNVPLLDRLIKRLEAADIDHIIFAVNYHAGELQRYLEQNKSNYKAQITFSMEPRPLGSGGAVKFNSKFLNNDTFLLLNGDILTEMNYKEIVGFHKSKNALITVNAAKVEDPTRFGVINTNNRDRVISWQEKPSMRDAKSNWVNVGIWAIEPELLDQIPSHEFVSLERDIFQTLVNSKAPFYAFRTTHYWSDIGTPQSYAQVNKDILYGIIPEPIPGTKLLSRNIWIADSPDRYASVQMSDPVVIGDDVNFGDNTSVIGPTVIGPHCNIGASVNITESILWQNVEVGANVVIRNSILGRNVKVAANTQIIDSVIADDVSIEVSVLRSGNIGPGTMLTPRVPL
jgi:mannose-1-phosphate guanylyltransferase